MNHLLLIPTPVRQIEALANEPKNDAVFWTVVDKAGGRRPQAFRAKWDGKTYDEIAAEMHVSRQYVQQMVNNVLQKLLFPPTMLTWLVDDENKEMPCTGQ